MEPPNNFIVTDVQPTSPSAYHLGISSVIPSKAPATSSLKPTDTPLPAPFAPTSQSTKFQYAAFPQKAPAAATSSSSSSSSSSQAPIGTTTSSNAGSQVVILAQIIIVIGLILVELTIVAIVLGLHKLTHRNPSPSPLLIKSSSSVHTHKAPGRRRSLAPYLQRKAELEDEQRKRHELHGGEGEQHLVHELDREYEVLQVADDEGGRVLSLKGIKDIFEMPERDSGSSLKTVDRLGRCELAGDECARELDSELLM